MKITWCLSEAIAELTREHGGWQARVAGRPNDERSRVQCFVPAQSDGARHWTKSAPRFPATESPGTSYSIVSGELLNSWTAGIDRFVAGLEAVGRQIPLPRFNYAEIHIKRLTCVLQFFLFFFPYIMLK